MLKVGFQGVYGSYSSMAALNYFGKENEFIGYENFTMLIDDLSEEKLNYAVLPVENSTTGQIYRTLDILKYKQELFAIGEIMVEVCHNLITFPNTNIEDIKFVYSHPEALSQCLEFFKENKHITPISYEDTAKSVNYIKDMNKKENAAIASELAGKINNMNILRSSVQDLDENTTRFLIFKKEKKNIDEILELKKDEDKLSCYFETKHESGELFKILEIFAKQGYNLLSLHSRATKRKSFEYGFFADINCKDISIDSLKNLMDNLKTKLRYFNLLGIYTSFNE